MNTSLRMTAFLGLISIATACSNGDGGGVSGSGGGGGGGSDSTYYVTPQTVQGLDSTQWVESGNSVFTNNLTVTITGICARGVATISATVNGSAVSETATCNGSGQFSWLKVFTGPTAANGDAKSIIFKSVSSDGTVLYSAPAFSVTVDDQVPSNPTVTPSGTLTSGQYINNTSAYTATGTSTAYNVTCSSSIGGAAGCGTFGFSGGNITQSDTLTVATSETYTYKAVDLAGNISSGVNYTALYSPTMDPALTLENLASTTLNLGLASNGVTGTNGSNIGGGTDFVLNAPATNGTVQIGTGGIFSNR